MRSAVVLCFWFLLLPWELGDTYLTHETFYVDDYGSNLEGRPLRLRCYHFGPPSIDRTATFEWFKNGEVIPGETKQDIHIQSLTKEDDADYICGIQGSDVPRKTYHLHVLTTLPQPTVFRDRLPVCGQSCSLECIIMSGYKTTDTTVYTWYKDSKVIEGKSGRVLRFDNMTEEDEGDYTCTARDGTKKTTSAPSLPMDVTPYVGPTISIKPSSSNSVVKGIKGDNLTLTCEVLRAYPSVPRDGFSWSYLPSHESQVQPLPERTKILTLGPLTREHGGQYICQARNDQDFTTVTMVGMASVMLEIAYLENITMTRDLDVSENAPLTLTCSVDSYPAAQLNWTANGKLVRHVTDNVDHYFILGTSCSDSGTYTCRASNVYVPDLDITATTHVQVLCRRDPRQRQPLPSTVFAHESAPLDFLRPSQTAMVIVHPNGQDIVTFFPNCSSKISPAFAHRCLDPYCDLADHHVSFTLTQLTEKDDGDYGCLEKGKQVKRIPNCSRRLVTNTPSWSESLTEANEAWILGVFAVVLVIVVIFVCKRWRLVWKWHRMLRCTGSTEPLTKVGSLDFEKLYQRGKTYVFPKLVKPKQQTTAIDEEQTDECDPLLSLTVEEAEYTIKNIVRFSIQKFTHENDLPSFLLHNTLLSKEENVILILSRKLGAIVIVVMAVNVMVNNVKEKAMKHLLDARNKVSKILKGLVKPGTIAAAIVFPNCSRSDLPEQVPISPFRRNVDVLWGRDPEAFLTWCEQLSRRHDSQVWESSPSGEDDPDAVFKRAASKFLTTAGYSLPASSNADTSKLLTPAQMEVRDSTAKFLHIWGPPGSGKTTLLINRAKQWLTEGKRVVLAADGKGFDVLLETIVNELKRGLSEENQKRIHVCGRHNRSPEVMLTAFQHEDSNTETCLIIDALQEDMLTQMLKVVKFKWVSYVCTACEGNPEVIYRELFQKAHELHWETVMLPESIRCTQDTMQLLNQLGQGSANHYQAKAFSGLQDRNIPKRRVIDHCLHRSWTLPSCDNCKRDLSDALPVQKQNFRRSDWIVIYTGNPHAFLKPLCSYLQKLGVPASFDSHYDNVGSYGTRLEADETAVGEWLKRVAAGVDEEGNPTVHTVLVHDIGAVEKEGVIVVHWDTRDDDPNCQSQGERESRLNEHRQQWIQAVASSKGQVILLLATPSPARSLLNLPEPGMRTK